MDKSKKYITILAILLMISILIIIYLLVENAPMIEDTESVSCFSLNV